LDALGLRAHEERNTEQHIGRQFAEDKHESVGQHQAAVIDFFVNIAYGGDAGHECAGIENRQQTQQQCGYKLHSANLLYFLTGEGVGLVTTENKNTTVFDDFIGDG